MGPNEPALFTLLVFGIALCGVLLAFDIDGW